jgi:DNA-binding NarL/FixJ family response regulator
MSRKRILIADDNPAIRAALCRMFADHPILEVGGEAVNGQDAVDKAAALRPELIILDLDMPTMNGLQAAKEISKILPNVPIILLTLHARAFSYYGIEHSGISRIVHKGEAHTLVAHAEDLVQAA